MATRASLRRLSAFAIDWLVIAVWGGVLFAVVMFATGGRAPRVGNPWTAQAIGFLTMTLPVTLYFGLSESSGWRASVGKRIVGLQVSGDSGDRLSRGKAILRNAIKFVPWELGHMVAQQSFFSGDAGVPVWVWGPMIVAMGGPLWWLVALILTGRTPYDRWTHARVTRSNDDVDSHPPGLR